MVSPDDEIMSKSKKNKAAPKDYQLTVIAHSVYNLFLSLFFSNSFLNLFFEFFFFFSSRFLYF